MKKKILINLYLTVKLQETNFRSLDKIYNLQVQFSKLKIGFLKINS